MKAKKLFRVIVPVLLGLVAIVTLLLVMSVSSVYADKPAGTDWIQTSQADFEAGVLNQVDTSSSPGDVTIEPLVDSDNDEVHTTLVGWQLVKTLTFTKSDSVPNSIRIDSNLKSSMGLLTKAYSSIRADDVEKFSHNTNSITYVSYSDILDFSSYPDGEHTVKLYLLGTLVSPAYNSIFELRVSSGPFSGTIASQVLDTGADGASWDELSWSETLSTGTNITFEVRASDTLFAKGDASPTWTSVGGTSPVTSDLPSGRYMQWRATLTTSDTPETPTLHDVTITSPTPTVDGLLDESYTYLKHFDLEIIDLPSDNVLAPTDLYMYTGTNTCYWAFVVDRGFNDNVYADYNLDDDYLNLDGWKTGSGHEFNDLKVSDNMVFDISYTGGSYTDLTLDYLSGVAGNWSSGQTGEDSSAIQGTLPISQAATSLHWNLENSGWNGGTWGDPLKHSPPYDYNETSGNYWEWQMIYEFSIPKSEMGGTCGEVTQSKSHNSPYKEDLEDADAKIGNYVWHDVNMNGLQDDDFQDDASAGIANVTVNLYDGTTLIRTTQTAPSGYYIFNNLNAGAYYVEFVLPNDDYSFSLQGRGSNDTDDSDANPTTGKTGIINLSAGETDLTWDAGLHLCDIGDRVWKDESGNGDQNADLFSGDPEPGFNDVDVYLYDYQPSTCGEDGYLEMTTTISGTSQTPAGFPDGIYGFDMSSRGTGEYWVCVDESTLPSAGEGMHWARTTGIHTTGDNPQKVTYTGSDDFSIDFGYVAEVDPTAVTLSSFTAKPSAGGSVSRLWPGLAGLTVLAAGSLFWTKRWVG